MNLKVIKLSIKAINHRVYNLLPVYTTCPVCVNSHVNCVLRCVIMDGDYFGVYVKMLLWLQIVVVSKLCFQKYLSARGPGGTQRNRNCTCAKLVVDQSCRTWQESKCGHNAD